MMSKYEAIDTAILAAIREGKGDLHEIWRGAVKEEAAKLSEHQGELVIVCHRLNDLKKRGLTSFFYTNGVGGWHIAKERGAA